MDDLKIIKSERGRDLIVYKKYTFYEEKHVNDCVKWRCTHRGCLSKLYLNESSTVIFRCELTHEHEEPRNLSRKIISNSAKRKAADQGGRFCKHICAAHIYGDTVNNLPNLTDNDRIEIGTLAVGNNFDHTFLHKMDIDKMETEMEAECATLNNKENKNLDNLNFHSSMDKFNMEIGVENDTNINNDNGLTNSEMDIELELLT
ncbi:hypothetical protein ACI65C_010925 [Semiaphis heraclei]